jgi:Tol biopolymer transport system component
MDTRRPSTAFALLLLVACSAGSAADGPRPTARANASPSISLDARTAVTSLTGRIVFDNLQDVWSINADGTDLTRLTRSPGPDFDATWSPDGARIAFRSERNGDPEICLMNADGSAQRRLADGLSPAWSPDGSRSRSRAPGTSFVLPAEGPGAQGSRS